VTYLILFLASLWAGAQNALAGGGSFITLPSLMLTGVDARAANVTSTVALFPGQIATGWTGRAHVAGAAGISLRALILISLLGGALGAVLLLVTPSAFFARLVPYLVLFATSTFAWGSFGRRANSAGRLGRTGVALTQLLIAVYGGYFGGGIGFLMLAALTAAGLGLRNAGATKNVLAAVMNASAVGVFLFSPQIHWQQAAITGAGASIGGLIGGHLLRTINERALRIIIVLIGLALTIGLLRAGDGGAAS
jgi:uncharacterized membrane protein YfcA